MTLDVRLSDLYLIKKEKLATTLFYAGMLIAFLGSLNPWFMWFIGTLYPIPASLCVIGSYLVARRMSAPFYTRTDYLLPLLAFILFATYDRFATDSNINGYIVLIFRIIVFFSLFSISTERLSRFIDFLCRFMGVLLAVSLTGHILYIIGIPLPGRDVEFGEWYSYTNHYLYLLDDRNIFAIVPRFNSIFLEPSHIGTACAFLLFTQIGQWKRWYNLVMIASIFFSFSLAAYIFLVIEIFLGSWIQRKKFMRKLLLLLLITTGAVITTLTYNKGENLVHDLILMRLEINDGKLVGDNRTTDNFETDYENFIESSDIIFGHEMQEIEFGNAGYRVFFYQHGIVGIILLGVFYFVALMKAPDKRAFASVLFIALLYFWVTAFMLWENIFIPLYATAYYTRKKLSPPC